MSALPGHLRWCARAAAAWVIVGVASCDSDTAGLLTPTATNHVLRVQASGAGSGTVTAPEASPPIACSISGGALAGVCAMAYPSNSAIRLVATPNASSTFSDWSGACVGTECVVDMSQERTVTAAFAARQAQSSR